VPALEPYLIEPIFEQFRALLPERKSNHPLGCHRSRVPERIVFEKLVEVLVFGCAYWRIADASCSESTLRRRRDEWIELGVMERLRELCLEAYDRLIGLELSEMAVDCCITKAPCGAEKAGRSPVDRGKAGIKRSMAVDASGIPLGTLIAPAKAATTRRFWSGPSMLRPRASEGCRSGRASTSTEATTRSSPAIVLRSWSWDGRSRGKANRRRFGLPTAGWSGGRARGQRSLPTRCFCGARSGWGG
jgi:transposase